MVKLLKLFTLFSALAFIISCGWRGKSFDTAWYLQGKKSTSETPDIPGADVEDIIYDPTTDPFEKAEVKDINANGFNGESFFNENLIKASFDGKNVPTYTFFKQGGRNWIPGDSEKNEYYYNGDDTLAGGNGINTVVYYKYKGKNQLFPPTDIYNTGSRKNRLERFSFFRFTGKTAMPSLDNCLMAVDKYTKLVFAYGKPTSYKAIMGNQLPTSWGAFEKYSTGPDGKRYDFYEYDPIGIVDKNGSVELFPFFKDAIAKGDYEPYMGDPSRPVATYGTPGKSPYLPAQEAKPPISGVLKVSAKHLKNINVTDAWGDHGNADSTDRPEFMYAIRARAYSGFGAVKFDSLASFKPDSTHLMPAQAEFIDKGTTRTFAYNNTKEYNFNAATSDLYLDLDSRVVEIDITGNDWFTEYESPIITLKYNRDHNSWDVSGDNGMYVGGKKQKPVYDTSFRIASGQKKDFYITIFDPSGEKMEIAYTIVWQKK